VGARDSPSARLVVYALGYDAATRRARLVAFLGAATGAAPIILAVEWLARSGWRPPAALSAVIVAIGFLLSVRAVVEYRAVRQRLRGLRVLVDDEAIRTESGRESEVIARSHIARVVEIDGILGGLRVESKPDPHTRAVTAAVVPRGGEGFGEVRARLEQWGVVIERRGRRGPLVRIGVAASVVLAIFFLPFLFEDLLYHSQILAAAMVVAAWTAMRWVSRSR
jgi:hypothetical protein